MKCNCFLKVIQFIVVVQISLGFCGSICTVIALSAVIKAELPKESLFLHVVTVLDYSQA